MAKRICQIEGCEKPRHYRDWCAMHYQRWKTHGDPTVIAVRQRPLEERFWLQVDKGGPVPNHAPELGQCWLWKGCCDRHGYGLVTRHGQRWATHRWSYWAANGTLPVAPMELDHLCRQPLCVRPDHLEAVPHAVNVRRGKAGLKRSSWTHCANGHALSEGNLIIRGDTGGPACRICRRDANRRYEARRAEAA